MMLTQTHLRYYQYIISPGRQRHTHVSILKTVTIPPCCKTEYLTPGPDIPSSPGREQKGPQTEEEKQREPQQVSERDRPFRGREKTRPGPKE